MTAKRRLALVALPMTPSHQMIAKRMGLSRSTVSRALSSHSSIPLKTRNKVLQVAKSMGYQRDALVSHLMSHLRSIRKTKGLVNLAYLTTYSNTEKKIRAHTSYDEFTTGARDRALELGYQLDLIPQSELGIGEARATKILVSRGIQGIVIPPRPDAFALIQLDWSKFSVASIGHPLPSPKTNWVSLWHANAMRQALRKLQDYGYQKIGYVISPQADEYAQYSMSSLFFHFRETASTKERAPFFAPDRDDLYNTRILKKWYDQYHPEVLIGTGTYIPEMMKKEGLNCPDDYHYIDLAITHLDGCYAGIFEKPRVVGATAVDLVVEQIHLNKFGLPENARAVLIEGDWVDACSLPRRGEGGRNVSH